MHAKNWFAYYVAGDAATSNTLVKPDETAGINDIKNGKPLFDDDVIREKQVAMAYEPKKGLAAPERESLAIVIQKMRHVFPNGFEAVKELSLSLQYGECFGLLGPNGAGRSPFFSFLELSVVIFDSHFYFLFFNLY